MTEPLSDYDYDLPPEQIAQAPLAERSTSRLLVLDRSGVRPPEHRTFSDVVDLVPPGAVVVLNETRVIPARLLGRRASTGGRAELLLVGPVPGCAHGDWEALVQTGGKPQPGEELLFGETGAVTLVELTAPGRWRVRFPAGAGALDVAAAHGQLPLPPYIKRAPGPEDDATYQTVYARVPGAIAAPTAGLHFTPALLAALEARGVTVARLVLHVGLGTFCPVRVDDLAAHVMHAERYVVPPATRAAVEAARAEGRKVVAVGTTAVRALEAWAKTGQAEGETDLFIRPGFRFQAVDAMVTNFHLPRSTLLALVAAFAGRERMLAAYAEAVARGYRFYSYGDAMFIA